MNFKLLGPRFTEQTPDTFHVYAKDVHKFQNIKRPEASKPKLKKTRKKQTPNGKYDNNSRLKPSSDNIGKTQEDVVNVQDAGWQDESGNQFLVTITN